MSSSGQIRRLLDFYRTKQDPLINRTGDGEVLPLLNHLSLILYSGIWQPCVIWCKDRKWWSKITGTKVFTHLKYDRCNRCSAITFQVHWWAMLLISFASVASMIIFMRLCSYSTPSSRAYHYHHQQLRGPLPMLHPPPPSLAPRPAKAAAPRGQLQGMPREHFVPPFRLKRRRTIDPVNGVERNISELIPASSVPVPYHRSRGDAVSSGGGRSRPHPKKWAPFAVCWITPMTEYQIPILDFNAGVKLHV